MAAENEQAGGIPDFKWLASKIGTKGDLATVLIAAPIGFGVDLALSMTGLISPGTFALLTASGALGAKNMIEARWDNIWSKRNHTAPDDRKSLLGKAEKIISLLKQNNMMLEAKTVERNRDLFNDSLLSMHDFGSAIDSAVAQYRTIAA